MGLNPFLLAADWLRQHRAEKQEQRRDLQRRGAAAFTIFCNCLQSHALLSGRGLLDILQALVLSDFALSLFELLLLLGGKLLDVLILTLLPSIGLGLFVLDAEGKAWDDIRRNAEQLSLQSTHSFEEVLKVTLNECLWPHRAFLLKCLLYIAVPLRLVQIGVSVLTHRRRRRALASAPVEKEEDEVDRVRKALLRETGTGTGASASPGTNTDTDTGAGTGIGTGTGTGTEKSPETMSYEEAFGVRGGVKRFNEDQPIKSSLLQSLSGTGSGRNSIVRLGVGAGVSSSVGSYMRMDIAAKTKAATTRRSSSSSRQCPKTDD